MKTLAKLCRDIDEGDLAEVCRAFRLDDDETASVLDRNRACPWLLGLYLAHGGTAADFVRARVEIRRGIRASG